MVRLYGIWIKIPRDVNILLKEIINEFKDKYDSPFIEPHITILPAVTAENDDEIIEKVSNIVKTMSPFAIKFEGIKSGNSYWKSIFIEVKNAHDIKSVHRPFFQNFINNLFIKPNGFEPHLSLLYGDFNKKIKREIVEKIKGFKIGSKQFNFNQTLLMEEIGVYH